MDPPPIRIPDGMPNILVVGAGGIGCEIIKSLAVDGEYSVTVVDFDTISLSNLSRQFFYSDSDIGKEKAPTLAENAQIRYPNLKITGLSMNVLQPEFDITFIEQFDFVFCGVDNIAARSRVSSLCVYTRTPLVDCGSSGKFGQATPIIPYHTACYNCTPAREPSGPKVTCTIRSTPETIEHCSAWAFHLFSAVFGGEGKNEVIQTDCRDPDSVFNSVFITRIKDLASRTELWKSREPPSPLNDLVSKLIPSEEPISRTTEVWTDEESSSVFAFCLHQMKPPIEFDKDETLHLAFATASANLQARAFHIQKRVSMFDAKALVAVVEPALATTNSIVGGASVRIMKDILQGKAAKSVWMAHTALGPRLSPTAPENPVPGCPVCGTEVWEADVDYGTQLLELGKAVGVPMPSVVYQGSILFDFEDGGERALGQCQLPPAAALRVSDIDGELPERIVIVRDSKEPRVEKIYTPPQPVKAADESDEYSDEIEIL